VRRKKEAFDHFKSTKEG